MPTSVAPRIAAWQRRVGGQPGPYPGASASGDAPNGLCVELLIDGSWVNITSRVMVRDSGGSIQITRGQTAEGQRPNPGSARFQLNNRDGLFSTGNPMSPWWNKIGRNTQVRISVANGEDKNYRFWGEVPAWPESWDGTDTDVWIDVEAAGILRRLGQGTTPLRSTMYRGLTSAATAAPVAYWPCEDGSQSTSLASALGGQPMTITGSPSIGGDSGFACSAALPVLNAATFTGQVAAYPVTGQTQVRFLLYLPNAPADGTQLLRARTVGGTVAYWAVVYNSGGNLSLQGLDTDGLTVLCTSGTLPFAADGHTVDSARTRVSMELTQSGSNVAWTLGALSAVNAFNWQYSGTFTSQTVNRVTAVTVSPGQTITTGVFGHVSVQSTVTSAFDLYGQVTAFVGETVAARLGRLCQEQGVNYTNVVALSANKMGAQAPATFPDLLQECVDVDQGILFERETALGLALYPRIVMYNQSARLTLSYPGNQLSAVPAPVPDDQIIRNSITVSRPSGSSATAVLPTGPLSVQSPPLGVGVLPDSPTINVQTDDVLPSHAGWRLHIGTVNEPRYPAISVNLAHPAVAPLRNSVLRVIFGSRIVVTNPPSRIGGDISQIVIGIQETLTHFEHRLTFVCQPESPYRVGVVGSTVRRVDSANSVLAADMTPTGGTAQVTAVSGQPWTTNPTAFPFDITIGGEQMTVSGIDSSTPQNFTISARSVNGVVKSHLAGEQVHITNPAIVAL